MSTCICNECDKSKNKFYLQIITFCISIATLLFISGIIIINGISFVVGWICIGCGLTTSFIAITINEYYRRNSIKTGSINLTPVFSFFV